MRKLLILLLTLVLSISTLGLIACVEPGEKPEGGGNNPPQEYTVEGTEGLTYSIYGQGEDRYAGFTGLSKTCTATNIVIASHYQGVKVTEIGNGMTALSNFKNVESVKVHKYITIINSSAFNKCANLKTIDFEEDCVLEKIGGSAFKNSPKLENFNYFGKINVLGEGAFIGCTSLKTTTYEGAEYIGNSKNAYLILFKGAGAESVKVHKDCEAIHSSAFEEDTATKNITFESKDKLASIGGYAFYKSAITEIEIPKTVISIGEYGFSEANNLVKVIFDKESQLTSIGAKAFRRCSKLEELVNFEYTKITTMTEEMLYFGDSKTYPSALKYINIPKTVTLIMKACMWGCNKVEEINFAKDCALTEIEYHAFRGCGKVKTLIIPKTVTKIGYDIIAWGSTSLVIYCEATEIQGGYNPGRWNQYESGSKENSIKHTTYYYSETNKAGYWHYVNGVPTLW